MTDNPLLTPSDLPYGLLDFAAISDDDVIPAFRVAFDDHLAEVRAIVENPAEPTFENTLEALERSGRLLDRVASYFFNLAGTDATDSRIAIEAEIVPLLAAHNDSIVLDPGLWQRIAAVQPPEDEEGRRLLEKIRSDFERAGADLDEDGKARLKEINTELSELSNRFGENLLKDTQARAVLVTDRVELAGLSDSTIDNLRRNAGDKDGWLIPLELPSIQSLLAQLTNADLRARILEQSLARGTGDGNDNRPILLREIKLRAERAELLGFDSHADYVITNETAGSAAAARKLLTDLGPAAAANAEGEYKRLLDLADENIGAADWPYWAERRRAEEFQVDQEALRKYFPLDRVLTDGVFYAANLLYGITVEPRDDLDGYAPGTRVWEVKDSDDSGIGLLVTDFFARSTKRGGAWMSSFVDQSKLLGTKPVVVNVLNIPEPAEGKQALLTLDEVMTLFHEFGHGLHGLLSDVTYPRFSGTNVPRDFVEFPSQFNENWALEPAVLGNYAFHVETGEPIPEELVAAVKRAATAGEGFATTEYIAASALDLAWHSLSAAEAEQIDDVEAFEAKALEEAGLAVDNISPRYRSTYFNHIFAGGYSAGYYSYLWAEALDADGFDWFEQNGGATLDGGARLRELILSKGGSIDYDEAYRAFRGRDKDIGPLLARRGLAGAVG